MCYMMMSSNSKELGLDKMGNFNEFDLDIKKVEENSEKSSGVGGAITTIIVGSVLTECSDK